MGANNTHQTRLADRYYVMGRINCHVGLGGDELKDILYGMS
jgi:hypothetical protein